MSDFELWEEFEPRIKRISSKTKLDKEKFCKKNKIGKNRYGPHIYVSGSRYCVKCKHLKKEGKKTYEYRKFD